MDSIPSYRSRRWHLRKFVTNLVVAVGSSVLTIITAIQGALSDDGIGLTDACVIAILLIIAGTTIYRIFIERNEEQHPEHIGEHPTLVAWANATYQELEDELATNPTTDNRIRLTLHRLVYRPSTTDQAFLEQVISYAGDAGGPPGRKTSIRAGIVGYACRIQNPVIATRHAPNSEELVIELIRDWGYTYEEARTLSADRSEWLAWPIRLTEDDRIIGVLFLDATRVNTLNTPGVQDVLLRQINNLTSLIRSGKA